MKKYISIDIGGTAIKYGLIDENANILEKYEIETNAQKGGEHILNEVVKIVENFVKENQNDKIMGVCISTAGVVDTKKGSIYHASDLIPNYIGINFKNTIKEKFSLPCQVENDVNCAGLAEYKSGASKDSSVCLTLTIGTGIGGCGIVDGKIIHGANGSAFEVGYMNIRDDKFENLGSAKVLVEKVAKEKKENISLWNGKKVFENAKKGDKICIRAIDEMCDVLGLGIANLSYMLNPDTVVLGGGIMAQEEYLKKRIEEKISLYLEKRFFDKMTLKFAKHQNQAGILGAYYNFRDLEDK
ncbi:MAG: ROK family protein [Anaerococcus vaginalis]|nr:ROK family protein [Anaerococcus vaginalis]